MREQKAAQVGEKHWNWKGGPDNWAINQPGAKKKWSREYVKKRYNNDPQYRIACNLRRRLTFAVMNHQKTGSAVRDLGCSIAYLIRYIEALWEPWMNWSNYGNRKGQWSIDHIIPLSAFDLTDRQQLLKAVHYTNLRPLPQCHNRDKLDRVPTRSEHRAIMKEIRAKTAHLGNPT
jgi:5-methylcytosine-specific restriction endonuclease McrA